MNRNSGFPLSDFTHTRTIPSEEPFRVLPDTYTSENVEKVGKPGAQGDDNFNSHKNLYNHYGNESFEIGLGMGLLTLEPVHDL